MLINFRKKNVFTRFIVNRLFKTYYKNQLIVRISKLSIAIGVCVIIITLSVVNGFQGEIKHKIIGLGNHVTITRLKNKRELAPITINDSLIDRVQSLKSVKGLYSFAYKSAIIKVEDEIYSVLVKGLSERFNFDWLEKDFFIEKPDNFSIDDLKKGLIISERFKILLGLKLGDEVLVYYIHSNGRFSPRKMVVKGVYKTGLSQYDDLLVFTGIKPIQKINKWTHNQADGYEIFVDYFENILPLADFIYNNIVGFEYEVFSIFDKYPQMFDWIEFQDINLGIIMTLMVVIAIINAISAFLIMVLDKTQFIGVFKSLGAKKRLIKKIFFFATIKITLQGMFIGNLISLILLLIQYYFKIVTLNEETYYISYVPVAFPWLKFLIVNLFTFFICYISLLVPATMISKIRPIKVLRMD